ncbi:MAG: TetR/AcrR family transcriptional regulator [Deltaproteobacteria bacterium]
MRRSDGRGLKRDSIIDAAVQVFSSKGYHNTRMEEIAIVAGIGKGTIYEYFESKLQLFQALMERSLQTYYDKLATTDLEQLGFRERLCHLLEGHFTFSRENKDLARIICWDTDVIDEELKEWGFAIRKEKEERLKAIVEEAITRGELRRVDPYLATLMISGCMEAMYMPIIFEDWERPADILALQVADLIMQGIGSK